MKTSTFIKSTVTAILLSASVATAQIPAAYVGDPVVEKIAADLAAQGFEITEVRVTLLGRYKIEASASGYSREVVVAPSTGRVLRDRWEPTVTGGSGGSGTEGVEGVEGPEGPEGPEGTEGTEGTERGHRGGSEGHGGGGEGHEGGGEGHGGGSEGHEGGGESEHNGE